MRVVKEIEPHLQLTAADGRQPGEAPDVAENRLEHIRAGLNEEASLEIERLRKVHEEQLTSINEELSEAKRQLETKDVEASKLDADKSSKRNDKESTGEESHKKKRQAGQEKKKSPRANRSPKASDTKSPKSRSPQHQAKSGDFECGQRVRTVKSHKKGTIKFVGTADNLPDGIWIGIELDDPVGKHDGTVKGKRLFTCEDKHGALMRSKRRAAGGVAHVLHGMCNDGVA